MAHRAPRPEDGPKWIVVGVDADMQIVAVSNRSNELFNRKEGADRVAQLCSADYPQYSFVVLEVVGGADRDRYRTERHLARTATGRGARREQA